MNKKQFDSVIRRNLSARLGNGVFGYGGKYQDYYTKQEFDAFVKEMMTKYKPIYDSYYRGKGSELKEQNSRYGMMPPKMASVASSSRFCYLALRDGAQALGGAGQVEVECGRAINGIDGIPPQLDAYISDGEIYVEAKCHEIFDIHKPRMKIKYWEYIYGENNDFGFEKKENPKTETFEIPFSEFGISKLSTRFDIKQFLCHLMGIASSKRAGQTSLVYLFFKPIADNGKDKAEIDEVFAQLKAEIEAIFTCKPISNFIKKHGITLSAVAEQAEIMEPLTIKNMIYLFR